MAKSTRKGLLERLTGRGRKVTVHETAEETGPVIDHVIPDAELPVDQREDYMLLSRAINMADTLGIAANTRRAALTGMERMAQSDPADMAALISRAGAFGAESLRPVIMELAGYGRARVNA